MSWDQAYLLINVLSGFLLVVVGAIALATSHRRPAAILGLFLLVWGAQTAIIGLGTMSGSQTLADLFFLLSELLVPLTGLLLLFFATEMAHQARGQAYEGRVNPERLHNIGKWLFAGLALGVVGGLVAAALVPGSIVSSKALEDGTYQFKESTLGQVLMGGPRFIGVAAALIILSLLADPAQRKKWFLVLGLGLAWTYSFGYTMTQEILEEKSSWIRLVIFGLATLMAGLAAVFTLQAASRKSTPHKLRDIASAGTVLLMAFGALLAPLAIEEVEGSNVESVVRAVLTPGFWRLLALGFLAFAVADKDLVKEVRQVPVRRARAALLVGLAFLTAFVALLLMVFIPELQDHDWTRVTSTIGLLSLVCIAGVAAFQLMRGLPDFFNKPI